MAPATSNAPRFLVAKYVPDLTRMEPRNIGVILWMKGATASRFLRKAAFAREPRAFHRWISYWQRLLSEDRIDDGRGGFAEKGSEGFLDALMRTQRGEYILFDGGFITEPVQKSDLPAAAEFLFAELVTPRPRIDRRRGASN